MNSHLLTAEEYITQFKHESEDLIALLDGLSSFALQAAENDITETYAGSRPGETIRILTKLAADKILLLTERAEYLEILVNNPEK